MAESYRFFNSSETDVREYNAAEFAEYFSRFLSDGVYTENGTAGLKVVPGAGLAVDVQTGYAFVRGYLYKNDAVLNHTLDAADPSLDRVDRIVLRFDELAKTIGVIVKKGTVSSQPVPPALEVTSTVKEMSLAKVKVAKNATTIAAGNITDERFSEFCGTVSSLINVPVNDMWADWLTEKGDISNEWLAWFLSVQNDLGVRIMVGETEPDGIASGDIWFKELPDALEIYRRQSDGTDKAYYPTTKAENVVLENSKTIEEEIDDIYDKFGELTSSDVGLQNVTNDQQLPIAGGTMTGVLKAQTNVAYTTAQVRNVILSTGDAVLGSMSNGDIWIKYV